MRFGVEGAPGKWPLILAIAPLDFIAHCDETASPKRSRLAEFANSLYDLVGAAEERRWQSETERLCSPEVDEELDFSRLIDW